MWRSQLTLHYKSDVHTFSPLAIPKGGPPAVLRLLFRYKSEVHAFSSFAVLCQYLRGCSP
jgi:hypothetical protein